SVRPDQPHWVTTGFGIRQYFNSELDQIDPALVAACRIGWSLDFYALHCDCEGCVAAADRRRPRQAAAANRRDKCRAALPGERVNRNCPRLRARLRADWQRKHYSNCRPDCKHSLEYRKILHPGLRQITAKYYKRGLGGTTATHGNVPFFL